MNKIKGVVMLPTEKAEDGIKYIFKSYDGSLCIMEHESPEDYSIWKPQHIYVYEHTKIKKHDHYYNKKDNIVLEALSNSIVESVNKCDDSYKIISTTNRDLEILMLGNKIYDHDKIYDFYGFKSGVALKSHLKWESLPNVSESFIKVFIKAHNNGTPIINVAVECVEEEVSGNNTTVLKLSKDGNIIIQQTKKYTREEVVNLIHEFNKDKPGNYDCSSWIEKNI